MAVDLSVEFCGIGLENPLILSAGPLGHSGERMKAIAEQSKPGMLTTTTICGKETGVWRYIGPGSQPSLRCGRIDKDHIVSVERSRPWDDFFDKELKIALSTGIPVIVSIMGSAYPETWVARAKRAEKAGATMIEVNFCTPHGFEWGGGCVPFYNGFAPEIIREVKKAVGFPVDIPIIATGGVNKAIDVIEYLMVGATVVGVHTAIQVKGLGFLKELKEGVDDWMEKHGYKNLDEIRGMSLEYVGTMNFEPLVAVVNKDLCNGCGQCETVCSSIQMEFISAITVDRSTMKAKVNESICEGCGWCSSFCPEDAITHRGWPEKG